VPATAFCASQQQFSSIQNQLYVPANNNLALATALNASQQQILQLNPTKIFILIQQQFELSNNKSSSTKSTTTS
jgi:hypothetical protein